MFSIQTREINISIFNRLKPLTLTLARLARKFLDRAELSLSTQRSYEFTLMPLLAEYGAVPVEMITRQMLVDYLNRLSANLAITTHHRHQAIIQALFNYAIETGALTSNPLTGLKPRPPNKDKGEHHTELTIRYLSDQQLTALYELVAPDARMHAIVRLLHRTGARIGELLAVDLAQVDISSRKFPVVGKGNKYRWCFYSEDAAIALNDYVKFYREPSHPALFTAQNQLTKQVTRLSYRRVHTCWSWLVAQHPLLKGIRLHDLRHTFATERVGLMGIEELRALMGHADIHTTLLYQKVTSHRAELVAQKALNILTNTID
ncbi:tyrosine-type recombinase/integrase [Floridanema evergladense]|uniref:tyrosine-type recombinase/integrase n=1 Tax=Floridanema evergladense TaxID=3396172 RepID=UPI0039A49081